MKPEPIIVERTFNAPAEKVWEAITVNSEMKKWYFELKDFKPEKGFKFEFYGGEPGGKQWLHFAEITEVVPMKRLQYSWSYEEKPGMSYVTMELFPEGNKTRFKLIHEGVETFGGDEPFAPKNFAEGWTEIIGSTLKNYLEAS